MSRFLVFLVAMLLLGGCGSSTPSAKAKDPSSPSSVSSSGSSSTPSPGVAPPVPRAARANSTAGGTAFARYFFELHNFAMRTGETEQLRASLAPECFMCLTIPGLIDSVYGSGGHIEGGFWTPVARPFLAPGAAMKGRVLVQVSVHLQPMKVLDRDGRPIASEDGSVHDRTVLIWTSWRNERWYVENLGGVMGQQL